MPTAVPDAAALHASCTLQAPTPRDWAGRAAAFVPALLLEQAHLEKKAAAAAARLLFQVPQQAWMQRALSQLAREELVHFERTLRLLADLDIAFGSQQPSDYAEQLKRACRRTMPERLVDELLVGALIEARSCERMELLATGLAPTAPDVAAFYADLVAAEARHRCIYLDIAAAIAPPAAISARWSELAMVEAAAVAGPFAPHLHGGAGP